MNTSTTTPSSSSSSFFDSGLLRIEVFTAVVLLAVSVLILRFWTTTQGLPKMKIYIGYLIAKIGKLQHQVSESQLTLLERRQILSIPTEDHNDSWYFHGAAKDVKTGQQIDLVTRMAFREKKDISEAWFYVRHPQLGEGNVLTHVRTRYPISPPSSSSPLTSFSAGPLHYECITPLKKWKVTFDGELLLHDSFSNSSEALLKTSPIPSSSSLPSSLSVLKRFRGHGEFEYIMDTNHFNFDLELDDWATASALSREPWSLEFFRELKERHQTHYEQNGKLSGTLELQELEGERGDGEGKEKTSPPLRIEFDGIRGMRDHSFGSREWGYIDRWIALFGTLSNGDSFNLVMVRMSTLSRVVAGYYRKATTEGGLTGGKGEPIVDARPELEELGELNNSPPPVYDFEFQLQSGRWLKASCFTSHMPVFVLGDGSTGEKGERKKTRSHLYEGLARFIIDDVEGTGISEFTYSIY